MNCQCTKSGYCQQHDMNMTPGMIKRCKAGKFIRPAITAMAQGADQPPLPYKYKRDPETARLCLYLGANLSEDEVEKYKDQLLAGGIPCKNCNGSIPGHHCSHPEAGPFTRIAGKCTSCDHWKKKA